MLAPSPVYPAYQFLILAREGLAMIDPRYVDTCSVAVQQAENQARQRGLRVWGDPNFFPPWEFRPNY